MLLAQYHELAIFSHFVSNLDKLISKQLSYGQKVTELLKQKQYAPMSIAQQALSLFAAKHNSLENIELTKISSFEMSLLSYTAREYPDLLKEIDHTGKYNNKIKTNLNILLNSFKTTQSW